MEEFERRYIAAASYARKTIIELNAAEEEICRLKKENRELKEKLLTVSAECDILNENRYNPYHDDRGRFTTGGNCSGGSKSVDKSAGRGIIEAGENQPRSKERMDNSKEVREWYYKNVHDIPNQIDKSKPFEEQVKQAFNLRNEYKHKARAAMSDEKKAALLERLRPVPEFEELVSSKMKRKGMTRAEALQDILETASKTNSSVDEFYGL